jgi:hypothetical protein
MELFISLALGIGLSAACGFRIFVPLLVMSAAANTGYLELADSFAWVGTYPALLAFAVATLLEVLAYYIPWVDNLLDSVATPAAAVAGTLVTAAVITDMDPWLRWTLAVIAGGGTAGVVQAGTAVLRGLSSMATGGFGNFLVATGELIGAVTTALLALFWPFVALLLVVVLLVVILTRRRRRRILVGESSGQAI